MAGNKNTNELEEINKVIGARLKELRISSGFSQERLGADIGVSYQQVNKYEQGVDSIRAGRLVALARTLGVPTAYFFETLDFNAPIKNGTIVLGIARDVNKIKDLATKKTIANLVRNIVDIQEA